tara:strand:+ start:74 stop:1663 length:1590 start_codon:yes stop_codon:yes gene_type:complete
MYAFFKNNIFSVSLGTSLSKLAGFFRQIFIAAAFGVGVAYDAYNYAYIIPGFLIIIIGGINGPLHNSIVTILTPIKEKRASQILQNISIKIICFLFILGLIIFLNAELIINIIGPNLNNETQLIAAKQLRILSLCIPLSGFNGLSYGALNSKSKFFISSISPAIVSIVTIIFIIIYWFFNFKNTIFNNLFYLELLPLATLCGTLIQTIIQISETYKVGLFKFKLNLQKSFSEEKRIFNFIIPASISSGLGQINVFVDMFFASSFRGAASGLSYGNFLVQAPLGILSNTLILPILPKFSKLIRDKNNQELNKVLISSIEYCFLTTFLMMGFFLCFNDLIIDCVFQRGAFNNQATIIVKAILAAYAVGLPAYLFRDLLIRIYYALEQTNLPFNLSLYGIGLNFLFDWLLIGAPIKNYGNLLSYNFGVVGLVLSSGIVNVIICIILSINLKNFAKVLPHTTLLKKIILMLLACILSIFISHNITNIYNPNINGFIKILKLSIGSLLYFSLYFFLTKCFRVNKIKLFFNAKFN